MIHSFDCTAASTENIISARAISSQLEYFRLYSRGGGSGPVLDRVCVYNLKNLDSFDEPKKAHRQSRSDFIHYSE